MTRACLASQLTTARLDVQINEGYTRQMLAASWGERVVHNYVV